MKTKTTINGEEKRVEADVPSTENEMSEVAPTTSPKSNNPEAKPEMTTPEDTSTQDTSVTCEASEAAEDVQFQGVLAGLSDSKHIPHQFTEGMRQWLTDNYDNYELYLLHALLHEPRSRSTLLTLLTPDDFAREEYALVVGAMIYMEEVMRDLGHNIPTPPTPESLRTYMDKVAMEESFDDATMTDSMELVQKLQDSSHREMHYTVQPYFEAWYGSIRGKKIAGKIQMERVPDVRLAVECIQKDLHAASQIDGFLNSRKFDFDSCPEEAEPLLTFRGHSICTPGNIVNIQGPPKSAKSAVVGAVLAATLHKRRWLTIDTLGFKANLPPGQAVLHFDTEQSDFDHDQQVRRAYTRAEREDSAGWLYSYRFTGMDPSICWSKMQEAIYEAVNAHKGVSLLIIDGIADFCNDPNDSTECFELVRKLHALASDYECGVITVLHQNPGSQNGKTRGHLGSQIERKAETSLRVEKDSKSEVFQAWADSARSCHIPKAEAWRFQWSDEKKMHVTLSHTDEGIVTKKPDKSAEYSEEVREAYCEQETLGYSDLVSEIMRTTKLAESTAKARIREYTDLGLIEKDKKSEYRILIS